MNQKQSFQTALIIIVAIIGLFACEALACDCAKKPCAIGTPEDLATLELLIADQKGAFMAASDADAPSERVMLEKLIFLRGRFSEWTTSRPTADDVKMFGEGSAGWKKRCKRTDPLAIAFLEKLIALELRVTGCMACTHPDPPPSTLTASYVGGGYEVRVAYGAEQRGSLSESSRQVSLAGDDPALIAKTLLELDDRQGKRAAEAACKFRTIPFVMIPPPVVLQQQCCPQPTSDCRGSADCCATPVVRSTCNGCRGSGCRSCRGASFVSGPRYVPSCNYCRGAGCSSCRGYPSVSSGWMSYYRRPEGNREFWCDCDAHQQAVIVRYGYAANWRYIPCMCPPGCSRCGGSGRCGHRH